MLDQFYVQRWFDKQRKVPSNTNLPREHLRMIDMFALQEILDVVQEEARQQGYDDGYSVGYDDGFEEAYGVAPDEV